MYLKLQKGGFLRHLLPMLIKFHFLMAIMVKNREHLDAFNFSVVYADFFHQALELQDAMICEHSSLRTCSYLF